METLLTICSMSLTWTLFPAVCCPSIWATSTYCSSSQVILLQWSTLIPTIKRPEHWGWKLIKDQYLPVATDIAPAPQELMDLVKCACRPESLRPCSLVSSSCLKHGLPCPASCKHCRGQLCENADPSAITAYSVPHNSIDVFEDVASLEKVVFDDALEMDIPWKIGLIRKLHASRSSAEWKFNTSCHGKVKGFSS